MNRSTRMLAAASGLFLVLTLTSGGWAFSRPETPPEPNSSDGVIVTKTEYDDAGNPYKVTDNTGIETRREYDALGRPRKVVENYDDGAPLDSAPDVDRITTYTYNAANQIATQTADLEDTESDQTTLYVYSIELNDKGCPVKSNTLLRAIIYPDSDDTSGSGSISNGGDSTYDRIELTYYADGSLETRKDSREAVHTYVYDDAGRLIHDRITSLGRSAENVEGSVLRISRTYEARGLLESVASYDNATVGSGSVLNEVVYEYDGLGRLVSEYQEHGGAKTVNTHALTLDYDDTASSYELTKGGRLTSVTYPNGRKVHWVYDGHDAPTSIDDAIGRANKLAEDDGSGDPGDTIVEYSYLGSGTAVIKDYPAPEVKLSYADGTGDDPYDSGGGGGFDRFGRVVNHGWVDYSDQPFDLLRITHAYDRASNRLYAQRGVYVSHSEAYTYDDLHRLVTYHHGNVDSYGAIQDYWKPQLTNWTLDSLGNQIEVGTREDTTDYFKNTPNKANEYTARDTQGLAQAVTFSDGFDDDTSGYYVNAGSDAFDVDSTNAGALTVTELIDDTGDDEAAAIILLGDGSSDVETGPVYMATSTKFPSGAGSGQAGFVFGYQSANSYWLLVNDLGDDTRKLYYVDSGSKTLMASTSSAGITANTWEELVLSSRRGTLEKLVPYNFTDGFPSGRIGLWTNCDETQFAGIQVVDNAYKSDMLGRLANYSANADAIGGGLTLGGYFGDYEQPTLLRGIRGKRFQVVFSIVAAASESDPTGYDVDFVFNARGIDDFDFIRIYFANPAVVPQGYEVVKGLKAVAVTHTPYAGNMPDLSSGGTLWVRVTSDGATVKVQANEGSTEPIWGDLSQSPDDLVYESTDFDFTTSGGGGGQIGFKSGQNLDSLVDNLTVKTDRDSNGSYETTDLIETFTTSSGYAEETPTYDAAGNLTYDGVFSYVYDAWNRLVKVTKAYRDPTSGDVEYGSVISISEYDGTPGSRRIVRTVQNSGDLDYTYHYYFHGQSVIEERNGSDYVMKHYVWNTTPGGYIDELVLLSIAKSIYANPDYTTGAGTGWARHFHALPNANYNIMMLVEALPSGGNRIIERYEYTPYGEREVYTHGFLLADGNRDWVVNLSDNQILGDQWGHTGPNLSADYNGDGSVGFGDLAILGDEYNFSVAYANDPLVMYPSGGGSYRVTGFAMPMNVVGHQGLFHDEESGLAYNRARMLHPHLGRFVQRDPLGYVDGLSVYANYAVMTCTLDASGLAAVRLLGDPQLLDDGYPGFVFDWQMYNLDELSHYAQLNYLKFDEITDWNQSWHKTAGPNPITIIDNNHQSGMPSITFYRSYVDHQKMGPIPKSAGWSTNLCAFREKAYVGVYVVSRYKPATPYPKDPGLKVLEVGHMIFTANAPPMPGLRYSGWAVADYRHIRVNYTYIWVSNEGDCCGVYYPEDSGIKFSEQLWFEGAIHDYFVHTEFK
ncbi:MAG: hypothetical protein IT445_06440 [Phycisphaeraceae bacterium]|nr:hypothetical protein [Phycisphaeraceae bacterium]